MRIQKYYIWYCAAIWFLWITTIILALLSGSAFNIHNEALYYFVNKLSGVSLLLTWIPIHIFLFIPSIIYSIKNKCKKLTVFNLFSIIITTILSISVLICHVWHIGGV